MNKVIAVNLNGIAYQLEETGYDQLRAYLDGAAATLLGNPDRDEILADIEQAIGDKFRASLDAHRNVVAARDVERVIAEMGPVAGAAAQPNTEGAPPPAGPAQSTSSEDHGPRRLYLIKEGAMVGGVCNGIAAYVGVDVSIIRVLFAIACLMWGMGLVAYLVLYAIVPTADTPEQKARAHGLPKTAEEFIRRAKEGYYEGMKTWGDREAHRAWKRKFRQDMRGWGRQFKQEMKAGAYRWRGEWHTRSASWGCPVAPGVAVAGPFLCAVEVVLGIIFVVAIISLIRHRSLFGIGMPVDLPLGIALLTFAALFHFATFPVRAARRARLWTLGYPRRCHSGLDHIAGWTLFGLFLWWANRHVPAIHQLLIQIPPIVRQTADAIAQWFRRHTD